MHHSEHLTQTHTASCWVSLPEISVLEVLPLQRESSYLELILHLHLLVEVGGGEQEHLQESITRIQAEQFSLYKTISGTTTARVQCKKKKL